MAAMSTLQGKVFDFFQLPRELRDFIYEGLTCDINIQGEEPHIQRAVVHNAPIEKLLTLNKQFNDEYDQHVREASQMVIEDGLTINCEPIPLGKRARDVKRVEIRLLMFSDTGDYALDELDYHKAWVGPTIRFMAKIESIVCNYCMCVAWDGTWLEKWQEEPFRTPFAAFINCSSVTTLNVQRVQHKQELREDSAENLGELRTSMAGSLPLLATWTRGSGWEGEATGK
ncbi:hypothetical protein LTR97_008128 [Elasticomyces elasticus]|uniref:Uncharacterized protein n=1 Tax=Elasticomyces elasticus TaxID=574655 RepID=A0AAN7W4G1_9PEZI|nr:hypothetical protein LTR97_008128 [Elasticomyces elasticus]